MSEYDQILVTGATGFVGANIVKFLAEKGRSVLGLDIAEPTPLVRSYLAGYEDRVEWAAVDLTDSYEVMRLAEEHIIGGVIHAAVFTPASKEEEQKRPRDILSSNLMGTVNALELAREAEAKRFVYVSSSGLYGRTPADSEPLPEDSPQPYLQMSGFYSITKIASEKLTERYAQLFPMSTTSMRIAAPYGPMERPTWSRSSMGYTFDLLKLVIADGKKHLRIKGLHYARDRTYVKDIARGLVAGLEAPAPVSPLYNVSCGTNVSVEEILVAIREATGIDLTWEEAVGDEEADCVVSGSARAPLSISRARGELGFSPQYSLGQGIREYCEWWEHASRLGLLPGAARG